ncbi:hypothetical protein PINS_up011463 [Pythium insidiosum]|nr:hypothetical protein PINS_up011463 [Pythium insidiosum]
MTVSAATTIHAPGVSVTVAAQAPQSTPSVANVSASASPVAPPGSVNGEWRDKDADRSARQQIARIILTLIMKSANRPASVNYNPREIARRLEHTLYMSASSREEYSNVQTLKARLQQALDNSRRRQMQLQQQQQQQQQALQQQQAQAQAQQQPTQPSPIPQPNAPTAAAISLAQQQLQAQQLQQQQLRLLQQRQQQQIAAQLQSQRKAYKGVPFPGATPISQPVAASQPLQMPISMQAAPTAGSAVAVSMPPTTTPSSSTAPAQSSSGGSSILDELEREADEMANGVSDEPIGMPESELQNAPVASSIGVSSVGATSFTVSPSPVPTTPSSTAFSGMPLSMPPDIGGSMAPSTTSSGFVATAPATVASSVAVPTPPAGVYSQFSSPHIQQMQQLQQLQQLRRMQQLQQLQQQQQVANAAANIGLTATIPGAAATAAQLQAKNVVAPGLGVPTPTSGVEAGVAPVAPPGVMQMSEAAIAQKREELKRRLIQLKHARTCTAADCMVDYCARTKALLSHVSRCANAQCTTVGCKSTRQLLSHFRKCRNLQCEVCSAIRPPMNESEQQLVLRRQQERLCMLRHASTCAAPQCVLPYCAGMRVLWKHICECHQRQCRTDHCISSRYVLSHFKQCNKMICEVCGPVRKAIKIVDSCKGNLPQLQLAASQVSEGVRNLIKIMNTMVGPGGVGAAAPAAGLQPPGATGSVPATQAQGQNGAGAAWPAGQAKLAVGAAAAIKIEAGSDIAGASVKAEGAADTEMKSEVSAEKGEVAKKKPLKFQTEKEKKQRRKEQAQKAKARVQAKAQAAAAAAAQGQPVENAACAEAVAAAAGLVSTKLEAAKSTGAKTPAPIHLSNGLVVRGSQAKLRADHHVSHQDISFLDSMTESQLDEHIRSLRFNFCGHITLAELKNRLMPLLTKLMESEYGWAFNNPVDPVQWNIPDYFEIIKCPMDLGSIKKRLEAEHYTSVEAFAGDVRLVFENCIAYNSSTNKFNIAAKQLLASFDKQLAALKSQLEKQLFKRCEQRKEEMCQLCGGDSFKFAPCMLFCSGPCAGRIRRHTHYYSDPRGEHHWCSSCYKQMKDGPIDMSLLPQLSGPPPEGSADVTLMKSSLLKRKNSEVAEEPWVECDSCKLWYHQICALFNERNHAISGEQEPFVCPLCVRKQRAKGIKPSMENGLKARRLPITRMAKLMEERVMQAIKTAQEEEATRMGNLGNADSIGFKHDEDEPKSETQLGVTIREVLSVDKQVQIKPRMGQLLAAKFGKAKKTDTKKVNGTPERPKSLKRQRNADSKKKASESNSSTSTVSVQLTYRSRCICVFQELDGVDVLIFTLYVQEYGPNSLSPNAGRVYISYLDSVNYFQPKKLRTLMHQHVLLGFLEDCRNRGFHTCHIWSCPPLKGDDYIFFCKPENQKIPKAARLRAWYQKLLLEAKKEGLVVNISNLYAEYYVKKKAAHELPYFEGDYWPRLAEDLIKQLEEKGPGRGDKPAGSSDAGAASGDLTSGDGGAEDTIMSAADGDGDGADELKTPSMSPAPSDELNGAGGADDLALPPARGTGKSAKMNGKSKKKRSKKGPDSVASTRSTTMTRSKKGAVVARPPVGSTKNVVNNDPLMQKLKGILEPQKDDFFVVDLHPKCHKCLEAMINVPYWEMKTVQPSSDVAELLEAIKKTRASSSSSRNAMPRHYHHYYCSTCYGTMKTQLEHRVEVAANGAKRAREICEQIMPLNEKTLTTQLADVDVQEIKFELSLSVVDPNEEQGGDVAEGSSDTKVPNGGSSQKDSLEESKVDPPPKVGEEKLTAAAEPPADTDTKTPPKKESKSKLSKRAERDLDDVIMPCEIFDTREAFLMYCQNNHCQFDQLRRAKHSSMMVLYHLFNQGTTGFTFSCSSCKTTLISGNRWNCSICPMFNLCDDCNAKTKHEHQLHLFKIVAIPRPGAEAPPAPGTIAPAGGVGGAGKRLQAPAAANAVGGSRGTKRDANGTELKRPKSSASTAVSGTSSSAVGAADAAVVKKNRKRKLAQASPVKSSSDASPSTTATAASTTAPAKPSDGASGPTPAAATGYSCSCTANHSGCDRQRNGSRSDCDVGWGRRSSEEEAAHSQH